MGKLSYQTIQVPNTPMPTAGPSARGQAVGAGVKLLHKAAVALNGWAVSWRVNRELEAREDDILAAIRRYEEGLRQSRAEVGVLVVAGIQEWAQPDPVGSRAQTFLSLSLGGVGTNYRQVLREYLARPKLMQGAPRGWRRKDEYLWVTR